MSGGGRDLEDDDSDLFGCEGLCEVLSWVLGFDKRLLNDGAELMVASCVCDIHGCYGRFSAEG